MGDFREIGSKASSPIWLADLAGSGAFRWFLEHPSHHPADDRAWHQDAHEPVHASGNVDSPINFEGIKTLGHTLVYRHRFHWQVFFDSHPGYHRRINGGRA